MDPGLIINVVALLVQLVDVIRDACQDGSSKRRKLWRDELHLFHTQLLGKLQFAKKIKQQALAVGFTSESLETLQNELQKFISSTKDLLSSKNCKKKDIQELRERAMGTLQHLMACIVIEMCMKNSEDAKAIKEMMAKMQEEQEMVPKNHGVHINISGNAMLTGLLPFVTDTIMWERFSKVLADEYLNLGVPTEASKDKAISSYVPTIGVAAGVGNDVLEEKERKEAFMMMMDMERPSAAKDLPKEEEKQEKEACLMKEGAGKDEEKNKEAFLMKQRGAGVDEEEKNNKKKKDVMEGAGMDEEEKKKKGAFLTKKGEGILDVLEQEKLENKKRKEAPLLKDTDKAGQQNTELNDNHEEQDNPNRNMQLARATGIGELLVSADKGSQWKVAYKWHDESMGMVIGNIPLEVMSKKLGYFYFEVKLEEMAELLKGKETRIAGLGVGVARSKKFRADRMAGKYSKSCGYDGRVGEVYYESRLQGDSSMGYLAKGDTIGVGLLQHNDQHCIFFTLNGDLRMCIPDHSSLCTPSRRHGGLLPVISLASAHVQVHVNFRGPFRISDLLAQVKATLRYK